MKDFKNEKQGTSNRKIQEIVSSILLTLVVLMVVLGTSLTEVYFFCIASFSLFFISIFCFEAIGRRSIKKSLNLSCMNGDLTLPLISNKNEDLSFETILHELETRDDSFYY